MLLKVDFIPHSSIVNMVFFIFCMLREHFQTD